MPRFMRTLPKNRGRRDGRLALKCAGCRGREPTGMSTAVDLGVLAMGLHAMTTDPVMPPMMECGAGDEPRTRDLRLGKPALYQLSYARMARIVR